jgi:hypothetical protein
MQNLWERSGKFEGDIMLTEKQRNGMIDPWYRWPNRVVPFVIDGLFSEYYNTELQSGLRGVEGNIHTL